MMKPRLQQYVNQELSDAQAVFRKGRGNRDQIPNIPWVTEKARETPMSASLTTLKLLTVWTSANRKILKVMRISDHLTCFLRKKSRNNS